MNRPTFSGSFLPRSLSLLETWGFGFSGLLLWLGTAPAMNAALGPKALWVWLPGTVIGIMLNLQIKRLGHHFPEMAGGTPNYTTHLLRGFPALARYGAIGYWLGWVSVPAMNAIILTDLIEANLASLGLPCPVLALKIGFTLLPFIVAFSGTRALGILHTFFVFPAVGFLITFCLQGAGWLSLAPTSPGVFPETWVGISGVEWAKWFFIAVYAVYGCETTSSFVAESRQPNMTLRCLSVTAGFIPVVYVGGSWLLMRLATDPSLGDSAFLHLVTASQPFLGAFAPTVVTFLITSGCLLSSATAVSNTPRVLYQLAQDGYLSPLFAARSPRGVLAPGLIATLSLSLICLIWGDIAHIVMITGTGYLSSMMAIHAGEWVGRREPASRWPWWSLSFLIVEGIVLVVGGLAWGWSDLAVGLLLPLVLGWGMATVHQVRLAPLTPTWWEAHRQTPTLHKNQDWIGVQVTILIVLVCSAVGIGWVARASLEKLALGNHAALFIILMMTVAFVGVAIACWTSLPQVVAIAEAREQIERTLHDLQRTQTQLVQSEKMSSLGQLVAGVAHEINNPVNFIHGNLPYIQDYTQNLLSLIELYQTHYPQPTPEIQTHIEDIDLNFLQTDLVKILQSMHMGTDRIRQIVLSLRNFSRMDEAEFKAVDIHEGLDSTLLILQHRLRARTDRPSIEVIKDYDQLPLVECYPGQLNQVFMNILANAIDALDELDSRRTRDEMQAQPSQITIRTSMMHGKWVQIAIADNGPGIPEAIQLRIFDPFFTTKAVGKGTGMGMSISYQIIAEKHNGKLKCFSKPGMGSEFVIQIPIQQGM